jgi:catecholate siderophore receptor
MIIILDNVRSLLLTLVILAVPTPAAAQPSSARPSACSSALFSGRALGSAFGADTTVVVSIDIPAQSLTDALAELARQATIRIDVDCRAARGVSSAEVSGRFTAAEALRRLLAGTGLAVRFVDAGSAMVVRAGEEEMPIYALTPLTVIGERSVGYATTRTSSATRTDIPLRDAPQSVTIVPRTLIADQAMQGMADVIRYVPSVSMGQGEGHRDAPTIRGNSSTADFFVDGVRDDAQYFRDLYDVERVEALKGSNAMIFGRGGGGGVINRVGKEAQWAPIRALRAEGGEFGHRRFTVDAGRGLGSAFAARLNALWSEDDAYRSHVEARRYGVHPTVAVALGPRAIVRAGFERYDDERTVDRGIPSFQGRPASSRRETFFGNPSLNNSNVTVHAATGGIDVALRAGLTLRAKVRWADHDKFYQNTYPGAAVNAAGTQVALAAYNNGIGRHNRFGQAELVAELGTGPVQHTVLVGGELGRQQTDNYRETGYFNNTATSFAVALEQPTVSVPITFRQSATDADAETSADVVSVYAQDQAALSRHLQLIGGVRYDRFAVDYLNHRNGQALARTDDFFSPRVGLVLKPIPLAAIYASYSVSFLPSSGDQFSQLTVTTQILEPEQFTNREVGAKWDVRGRLSLTAAAFQLNRTNTQAPDPADPARVVQTGEQRSRGVELGVAGNVTPIWQVAGGLSFQEAEVVSRTSAAPVGARVALVPKRSASLWNRVQVAPRVGLGAGVVHQTDVWAAIDNTVTLPGFTRVDAAAFLRLRPRLHAQLNVENVFDELYYPTSHGNNNIMPGAPRTLRVSLTAG